MGAGRFCLGNVIGVAKKQFITLTHKIMSNSVGCLKKVGMWGGPAIVRIAERRGGASLSKLVDFLVTFQKTVKY